MEFHPLPLSAPLDGYDEQAQHLLEGWRSGDEAAIDIVRTRHPRFLDSTIKWLPKRLSDAEGRRVEIDIADTRLAIARRYDFLDWERLAALVAAVHDVDSPVHRFESAVEAVINGQTAALATMLRDDSDLVRARSSRVTCFDPSQHRATLLHYVAANGVESYRQRTPPNAVEIARILLESGSDPNALASMYGGEHTTISMLVSSSPPSEAGVQVSLIDTLVDYGASVEPHGNGPWDSPLLTALAFGFVDAAQALVRRGARVETLPAAAGLGGADRARELLPSASRADRHRALAFAAQNGHLEVVRLLLDAGEDPDRYNPQGAHSHATPLHQAVIAGRDAVVRLLVERGARLDIKDTIYDSTPLGWAVYAGQRDIAEFLRARGGE